MTPPNALELSGIIRRTGDFTLGPLDFSVPRGGVVALVGNNGAGKTTLLDLIMGLGAYDAGSLRVLGHSQPQDAAAVKARAAYVNPDLDYSAWGSVDKALAFLSGFYPDWSHDRCYEALSSFALQRNGRLNAHSFGERIKFLLVTAFARDPDLILLDEPTIGLDIHAQRTLADWIGRLRQREDRTIIISTHQLGFLERMADHIALLHKGRLLLMSRIDSLLDEHVSVEALWPEGRWMQGVRVARRNGDHVQLIVNKDHRILQERSTDDTITIVERNPPTLEDIVACLTQEG